MDGRMRGKVWLIRFLLFSVKLVFEKPINVELAVPSCSMTVSSAPKTMNFSYGMPMSVSKSQVGLLTGVVGANALIANTHHWGPFKPAH